MSPVARVASWSLLVAALAAGAVLTLQDAAGRRRARAAADPAREAVRRFGLADLCLSTGTRYTRHPAQADRFAPFGELPGAPELAPSGGWLGPLEAMNRPRGEGP